MPGNLSFMAKNYDASGFPTVIVSVKIVEWQKNNGNPPTPITRIDFTGASVKTFICQAAPGFLTVAETNNIWIPLQLEFIDKVITELANSRFPT